MSLALSLPAVDAHPANPPEVRPAKVGPWLDDILTRDPAVAARLIGDALAATNRVAMSGSKRLVNDFRIESRVGEGTRVEITRWK